MTVTIPESVEAEGNVSAFFVPTLATNSVALINAGTDISCYLMPDWDGPAAAQNTGETRRFCSKQTFQRGGRVSYTISPLVYTYLPQELGTPGHAGNKVYEALAEGNTGFLVVAYGIAPGTPLVATDIADIFPVECLVQDKQARGSDEFAPLTVTQTLGVTGLAKLDVALVA